MQPFRLTATEAVARFNAESLTVEEYARSLLSRIQERDSQVQAWAYLDPDYVIEQAKDLDKIPVEKRGPLHGVSVAVKDIIYTKRMPTQYNSAVYDQSKPEIDAGSIAILKNAGALLLGKATTTEFAATKIGTKTLNPHDPARTPGGSSSGSAAAVGDFQAAIGLGSQTSGSMIRPASFNGIYGLKPTWNSITREGQKIHSLMLDTFGLFARSVEDLQLLADVFALADDNPPAPEFSIKGAKFALIKTMVWSEAGAGTISAMDRGVQLLRDHGAEVEEIELPAEFDLMPKWHDIIVHSEGRVSFLPEYRIAKEKLHQSLLGWVENASQITRAAQLEAFDGISILRPKIDKIAGRYAAIITPSAPDIAPVGQESTGDPVFNALWTTLHTPVINVPGFRGENDLPIGLSLVSPRYHDRHLLEVSKAVGRIFEAEGGWKRQL